MSAPRSSRTTLGVAAVVLLGAGLRIAGLASYPFEQDERYTVIESTALFDSPLHPGIEGRPLYYLLQHALFAVVPDTPFGLRILPFLFGVLGIWLTWHLGNRVFGPVAGFVGALLLALSPWHLHASSFARYYALVYALATLGYSALHRAYTSDRRRDYLAALLILLLGSVTHPSFLFPLSGALLGLTLVRADGRFGWRWPSRLGWRALWLPYGLALLAGYAALKVAGSDSALRNFAGRGMLATLRLVPAMIQWITPTVFVAGGIGALVTAGDSRPEYRRWGAMAVLGCTSALVMLVVASTVTDIYADYGMAMLPLLFVSAGAMVQLAGDRLPDGRARAMFAGAAGLVLLAGVVPSTVSHLSDGTRFDYRPAYRRITEQAPDAVVLTWPMILQQYYAPRLRARPLTANRAYLDSTLATAGDLWAVVSVQRYGIVLDQGGTLGGWLARRCRLVEAYERPRLDYRRYRVELHRCRQAGGEAVSPPA